MHASAHAHLELSVKTHLKPGKRYRVAELGSRTDDDVNSVRRLVEPYAESFVGLDVAAGPNVDVVMSKPYRIPLAKNSVDVVITTSTFEHIPFFWAAFLEIERVVKPGGFVFLVAPSRGHEQGKVDLWRFYPDAMRGLAAFSRMQLVESHTDLPPRKADSRQFEYAGIDTRQSYWGDTVGVFRKPSKPSRLVGAVRPVLTWWANRVGGIDHVPRPEGSADRRQLLQTMQSPPSAGGASSDRSGVTQVFGIDATAVSFDSMSFYVPGYAKHRPVSRRVLSHKQFEPDLHEFVAQMMKERPGSMVHAGAFFGDMLPSFAAKCPGLVYAFEPVAENYLLARETVETNKLRNVLLVHAGLGDKPQIARVETSDGTQHWGGGSKIVRGNRAEVRTQQVPILSIDQFDIDDLTLIQLDVEGHELLALEGAVRTIERHRPAIVLEDFRSNCAEFLSEHGYRFDHAIGARDHLYLPV